MGGAIRGTFGKKFVLLKVYKSVKEDSFHLNNENTRGGVSLEGGGETKAK